MSPIANQASCGPLKRLILVAGSVRAAAQSARRAGFQVIGVDLFGDTDTLAACDTYVSLQQRPPAIRAALSPLADVALIRAGGLGNLGGEIDRIFNDLRSLGPSSRKKSVLRSPSFLRELAIDCGLQFPQTTLRVPALTKMSSQPTNHGPSPTVVGSSRWLRKNIRTCGGLGVGWAGWSQDSESDLVSSFCFDAVFQQWVAGRSVGVTYLSDGDAAVMLGVCRSLHTRVGSCPFVYAGSYGPIHLDSEIDQALRRLGHQLARRTNLRGLFNVDVIIDRSGMIWLLEVNPRWSASCEIIERSLISAGRLDLNESLMELAYQAMLGLLPKNSAWKRLESSGLTEAMFLKRIVFARKSGRYRGIEINASDIQQSDVPLKGQMIKRGEPILTLIAEVGERDSQKWREIARTYQRVRNEMR